MAGEAASASSGAAVAPLSGWRLAIGAFVVSVGYFVVMLDLTVANVAVPHIAGELGVSPTQGTWIITAYAVAEAICVPLTGWLSKRFGTLRSLLYALASFMVTSVACGSATSLWGIVAFRALQGLSGAPIMPLAQVILLRIFPESKANVAMALSAMVAVIAPITGPIIGGYITDGFSWRWLFYLNIPIVSLCIIGSARMLAAFETRPVLQRIDFVGLAILVVWVGALQLMLDLGHERDWFASPLIVELAIASAIGFAAFLIWELTDDAPIVELHVLRHRGFWLSVLCMSIGYGSLMTTFTMVPLWTQTTMAYTATAAGFVVAPISLFSLLSLPLTARLIHRVDGRILVYWGLMWLAAVSLFRGMASPDMDNWSIAFPQLLQGLSTGFFMVGLTIIALKSVDPPETASASGLMAFSRLLCTAVAISWATTRWQDGASDARASLLDARNGTFAAIRGLAQHGLTLAQARDAMAQMLDAQGRTIAFNAVYATLGLICLIVAQLTWLIPRPGRPAASS